MTMLLMALAAWLVVRVVHALADAAETAPAPEGPVDDPQAGEAVVGLAGFEPTTP